MTKLKETDNQYLIKYLEFDVNYKKKLGIDIKPFFI